MSEIEIEQVVSPHYERLLYVFGDNYDTLKVYCKGLISEIREREQAIDKINEEVNCILGREKDFIVALARTISIAKALRDSVQDAPEYFDQEMKKAKALIDALPLSVKKTIPELNR